MDSDDLISFNSLSTTPTSLQDLAGNNAETVSMPPPVPEEAKRRTKEQTEPATMSPLYDLDADDMEVSHETREFDEMQDTISDSGDDLDVRDYRLVENEARPRKVSEKKKQDLVAFESWLLQNQSQVTAAAKARLKSNTKEESMAELVEGGDTERIISSPREYQIELFERAKEKNIIVVLDTGSGKTLIAAMLMRHVLDQELERRASGQLPKVTFFLVEKVALCFQQHAVLSTNLDYPIGKLHGDMTGMMKTTEFWDAQTSEHMAIVCTAQILLDCLNSGLVTMARINLLVLDEAHHTKKNHPYARIIKDHYIREPKERPRILGMTASPVDAQTKDLRAAAMELESLLCSEIATVSDKVLFESQARRQQVESKIFYRRLQPPEDCRTELWGRIAGMIAHNVQFRAHLEWAAEAASTLGPWCADRIWKLLMTDTETIRLTARTGQELGGALPSANGELAVTAVSKVQELVEKHELGRPRLELGLSSKVLALHEILEDSFCTLGTKRCMIFVEKRYTACLLADLFQQQEIAISGMVSDYIVGSQPIASSMASMSFRDQVNALRKFRRGDTNCLFATTVAEEGIDIPDCDLVIRFDLYKSAIQYIQSKGRARQKHSRYISMLEEGNLMDVRRLKQASRDASALRQFCSILPADRKVQDDDGQDDAATRAQAELMNQRVLEIPSTKARLTPLSSIGVLAKFVSSLPAEGNQFQKPEYIMTHLGTLFRAEAILPDTSPIKAISGFPQRSKQLARGSAAFEACRELIQQKHINDHLQPTFAKRLPAMRNARLAVSENKKAEYNMRIKPTMWSQVSTKTGDRVELFATTIVLEDCPRVSRHLAIVTRDRLPALPTIPLFFDKEKASKAHLARQDTAIKVSEVQFETLTAYTLKIFSDIFSKDFDASESQLPYFLAPVLPLETTPSRPSTCIDWTSIDDTLKTPYLNWQGQSEAFFHDKFVVDPHDGGRKMILQGINKQLRPSDPTPLGVPKHRTQSYRFVPPIIKEYSNSLWQKARLRSKWRDDQPVVNADLLSLRRNLLDDRFMDAEKDTRIYIILEPLMISSLPVDVVSTALTLPAVIHRIEDVLIALDCCTMFGLDIRPDLALEAVTKDSDNTGEHYEEQINFQGGMGKSYERLEFLGDCFLKMATTIAIFTLEPTSNEFTCHVERMVMICNQNLFNHAVDRNVQDFIRSKAFDRRTWYPQLPLIKGKALKTEVRHSLSQKSIADVCEAIIGAAYLTGTDSGGGMNEAVKAVTVMVRNKYHTMRRFIDYYAAFNIPLWQAADSTAAQRSVVDKIESATGYRSKSPPLLRSAFKHPSYPYENIPHYQRLEFLGDSLLDMAIVDYLFRRFPEADPQWLTEHKMAMVSNQFFGCLCVKLGLQKHLLITTSSVLGDINEYVSELNEAEEAAELQAQAQGLPKRQDFWIEVRLPPKGLADLVESLVGAMFVDSEYDYAVVQSFFTRFIQPFFENMQPYDTFASSHPVTLLTRKLQIDFGCTDWRLCMGEVPRPVEAGVEAVTQSDVVCALLVHRKVVVSATAQSGRYAKVAAAKAALRKFGDVKVEEFRGETGCTCSGGAEANDVH